MAQTMQIQLEFEGKYVKVELEDNAASREFVAQLPLSLEFSDYVGKEKNSSSTKASKCQKHSGL